MKPAVPPTAAARPDQRLPATPPMHLGPRLVWTNAAPSGRRPGGGAR